MANIPTYISKVFIQGNTSDIVRLLEQAKRQYPVLNWSINTYGGQVFTAKTITWQKPAFAFWNFSHPDDALIYKYYPTTGKTVYQREWNRNNWGSAYEVSYVDRASGWITSEEAVEHLFINVLSREGTIGTAPPENAVGFFLSVNTEDRPSRIWQTIGEAYPMLKFTIHQNTEWYGSSRYKLVVENGSVVLDEKLDHIDSSHDEHVKWFGSCPCIAGGSVWSWPLECRETYNKQLPSYVERLMEVVDTSGLEAIATVDEDELRRFESMSYWSEPELRDYLSFMLKAYLWGDWVSKPATIAQHKEIHEAATKALIIRAEKEKANA